MTRAAIGKHTGALPVDLQIQQKARLWQTSLRIRTSCSPDSCSK